MNTGARTIRKKSLTWDFDSVFLKRRRNVNNPILYRISSNVFFCKVFRRILQMEFVTGLVDQSCGDLYFNCMVGYFDGAMGYP